MAYRGKIEKSKIIFEEKYRLSSKFVQPIYELAAPINEQHTLAKVQTFLSYFCTKRNPKNILYRLMYILGCLQWIMFNPSLKYIGNNSNSLSLSFSPFNH